MDDNGTDVNIEEIVEKVEKIASIEEAITAIEGKPAIAPETVKAEVLESVKELLPKTEDDSPSEAEQLKDELSALREEIEQMKKASEEQKRELAKAEALRKLISAGADPQTVNALEGRLVLDGTESDDELAKIALVLKKSAPVNDSRRTRTSIFGNNQANLTPFARQAMEAFGFDPDTGKYKG